MPQPQPVSRVVDVDRADVDRPNDSRADVDGEVGTVLPSADMVEKYHAIYMAALIDLFNRNKGRYAVDGERAVLEIN